MFHTTIGNLGHLSIIISFASALLASFGYFMANANNTILTIEKSWLRFSKITFYIHSAAVIGIVASLFTIIYNHYYEYYYAWSHSSNSLPTHYMISSFWEGQEGSFLLWMFWHAVLGIILMNTQKKWEAPMMAIFALVQAFLASMILGISIGNLNIGSSPFILLRDFMTDAPIFLSQPEFVPKDGTGLNPLLQNYWMVIHPPTLFLGFATTLVPFSFCMAGLAKKDVTGWMKPALPWANFSALILGIGILMGAYWAYETLNFGGYWNWDPVENAVYVPWIILVAAIHSMIIATQKSTYLKLAIILVISSFILILYATFLTRSGILGNASVHSFTDLGLSGQLLLYLLAFIFVAILLCLRVWKIIPKTANENNIFDGTFWIFIGTILLSLTAFQVIYTTSIPVYNSILSALNIKSSLALPADQIEHYSKFQLWLMAAVTMVSGTGQFFYWRKIDKSSLSKYFYTPLVISALASVFSIIWFDIKIIPYLFFIIASVYGLVFNATIAIHLIGKKPKLSGGAVAHVGVGLMLIGVLFSAGYSKVVSNNTSGLLYSKEFTTQMNQDNVLLFRDETIKMADYDVNYKGLRIEADNIKGFVNKENIRPTDDKNKIILTNDAIINGMTLAKKGDTLKYMPENTFYEIEFKKSDGSTFTLFPRAQVNKEMGLLASPDIKKMFTKDLYSHVSSIPDPNEEREWSELETKQIVLGDTFLVNDYYAILEKIERVSEIDEFILGPEDAAVKAKVKILTKDKPIYMNPIYVIHRQMVGRISDDNLGLGIRLTLMDIDPKTGTFNMGYNTTQKDWVILKAMEKPGIDILWGGSFVVVLGFLLAIFRRKNS